MIIYFPPPFSKNGSDCAVGNLHIYALADITNNVNVRCLWNIHACTPIVDNWMDRFECDGLHDFEEFDSLSENRLISFDQQAICN